MRLKDIIPATINSGEIIDFSKDESIVILKSSFDQHYFDAQKLINFRIFFPAYISIMTSIEIYLKIHLTVFCYFLSKNIPKNLKHQLEILIDDTKLLNNFRYSVKSKYGHNLLSLITDLAIIMEICPEELSCLKSSIGRLAVDWVNLRYNTAKIITEKHSEIITSYNALEAFMSWMNTNELDVLNKII